MPICCPTLSGWTELGTRQDHAKKHCSAVAPACWHCWEEGSRALLSERAAVAIAVGSAQPTLQGSLSFRHREAIDFRMGCTFDRGWGWLGPTGA